MNNFLIRILVFLLINFIALAIGGLFTGEGVSSDWYTNLNKAPWTPPGWVFGAAWTTIMVCFSIYLAYLWPETDNTKFLIGLFSIQWILNVSWNPLFFHWQSPIVALVAITALTAIVGYFVLHYFPAIKWKSVLLFPYFIWLVIATSLNAYIVFNN